ncbi:MAG: replication-associated recombination protein A [Selenomonadaceae bacterium]|nr:replication-associated recombination protein A [Selenomonadaceae bacterium]
MQRYIPLAERMRPKNLDEFVGQDRVRKFIESGKISSMIFHGAPGTGKTTLARLIAQKISAKFFQLNAGSASVTEIRSIVKESDAILFLDEIHRFNKAQQDILLPFVEDGRLILIGATTENPFFEVNRALLSRVRLVKFETLTVENIEEILNRACKLESIEIESDARKLIAEFANGDARIALNILEQLESPIDRKSVAELLGDRIQNYDRKGDNHFDTISAFIKSMRGSDPDAAIHYLARMIESGEDLNFIARRVAICAAEDVGNADPFALVLAMAAVDAVQFVGLPEARIPLAQAVTYIASAKKSNAAYLAIDRALKDVRTRDCGEIPSHLRDPHSSKGFAKGYKYPHDYPYHFVAQKYLPDKISTVKYYEPTDIGRERFLKEYLAWKESQS